MDKDLIAIYVQENGITFNFELNNEFIKKNGITFIGHNKLMRSLDKKNFPLRFWGQNDKV